MTARTSTIERKTKETDIACMLTLDGDGKSTISTGLAFLDHMLENFCKHARLDLALRCQGDVHVDDHHTVEDCALVLGEAILKALGNAAGIARFGYAYAPLDEALSRVVIDFSGRPYADIDLKIRHAKIGDVSSENILHFFQSFATAAKATLHVTNITGVNDHHLCESAFKAFALAVGMAIRPTGFSDIPSTKGVLT